MDWDLGFLPEPSGKSIVFNQLLENLRSVHEQACARNAVLERELALNGLQCAAGFSSKDDPWQPSNFLAPQEGPPPRCPPRGTCTLSTFTPSTCTPRTPRSLASETTFARRQDYLIQGMDSLVQHQGYLSEQITKVLTYGTPSKSALPARNRLPMQARSGSISARPESASHARQSKAMHSQRPTITASAGLQDLRRNNKSKKMSLRGATMKFAMRISERSGKSSKRSWTLEDEVIEGPLGEIQLFLRRIVHSTLFTMLSGMITFAYAVTIAIETSTMSRDPDVQSSTIQALHYVFMSIFSVELLIRFVADGWATWHGDDATWNRLDVFFILSGATELVLEAASENEGSGNAILRAVRIFRVLRTLRLIRSLHHIYEFQKMAYAVLSSFKTLLCSLTLLCFVMFFFAVWFTQSAANPQMRIEIPNLNIRYGDLSTTAYTLFMSISGGISWDECYMPLFNLNTWTAQGFILYIALVYFGVLNVVTSVFVESVSRSVQQHKDIIVKDKEQEKQIAMVHVKELFKQVDGDGSGQISLEEMDHFLDEHDLSKYMEALDIEVEDTRLLFRLLDCDGSGIVDIEEFCEGCLRLKGPAKSIDLAALTFQLKRFFSKWGEFTGYVEETFQEIRQRLPKHETSRVTSSTLGVRSLSMDRFRSSGT